MSVENTYKSAFFIVPSRILDLPGLQLSYLRVYETVFQFWNHGKECYLNKKAIKERTGISSDSTIKDAFIFFEIHGEMKRITKNGKRYLVQPTTKLKINQLDKSKQGGPLSRPGGAAKSAGGGALSRPHNIKNINKKNNNKERAEKSLSKSTKISSNFNPSEKHLELAKELDLNVQDQCKRFIDYYKACGRSMIDWNASFNNWLRKANDFNKNVKIKNKNNNFDEVMREIDKNNGRIFDESGNNVYRTI